MRCFFALLSFIFAQDCFAYSKAKPIQDYYHVATYAKIRTQENGGKKDLSDFKFWFVRLGYNYRPSIYDLMQISLACEVGANKILKHVEVHEWAASYNHDDISRRAHLEIQDFLKSLRDNADPCSEQLHALYLIAALSNLYSTDEQEIPFLAVFLYHADRIRLVSPEMRPQLGPLWLRKNPRGMKGREVHSILGSYHCDEALISIDVTLPPLDLAAHFIHEMDHLLRDKLSQARPDSLSLSEWVLFDETVSIAFSSFNQRRLATGHLVSRSGFGNSRLYKIDHDMTLFKRGGRMDDLWKLTSSHSRFENGLDFLSQTFIGPRMSGHSPDREIEIQKNVNEIYQIVSQQYFNSNVTKGTLERLKQIKGMGEFDPLARFMSDFPSRRSYYYDPEIRWLTALEETLSRPSQQCEEFKAAIKNGELSNYIGAIEEDPIKGGNEGVRPTDEAVRFCLRPNSGL